MKIPGIHKSLHYSEVFSRAVDFMSRLIDSITVPNNLMFGFKQLNTEWVKIFMATVIEP